MQEVRSTTLWVGEGEKESDQISEEWNLEMHRHCSLQFWLTLYLHAFSDFQSTWQAEDGYFTVLCLYVTMEAIWTDIHSANFSFFRKETTKSSFYSILPSWPNQCDHCLLGTHMVWIPHLWIWGPLRIILCRTNAPKMIYYTFYSLFIQVTASSPKHPLVFQVLSKYMCKKPYVIIRIHSQGESWHSWWDRFGFPTYLTNVDHNTESWVMQLM